MGNITIIGMDLAKNVFHLVGCDDSGKIILKKTLKRAAITEYFANLQSCLIAMEACGGAHHWARTLTALGHQCQLLPPQYVKAYLRGNKNDYNDALAIAEAAKHANIRTVDIKTVDQQDVQALHRLREQRIKERTALGNQLRGLLAEYGIVLPKGLARLRVRIPEILEDGENGLTPLFRQLLKHGYQQLRELDVHIESYNCLLKEADKANEACQRLQTIPGFGLINASIFASAVGDGRQFRRGRDVSASIGIVPRQHSSGGKAVLLGISKRGDPYLRSLLIHGARAAVIQAAGKRDRLSQWINRIRVERGYNKATVAYANKMARIGWAILRNGTTYQAEPENVR